MAKKASVKKVVVKSPKLEKAIISSELVIKSLGLESPEVEIVEVVSPVEVKIQQNGKQFIVGSELLNK